MTKVRSRWFIGSSCASVSTGIIFTLLATIAGPPLPAQSAQSMLDPYADIQPSAAQPDAKLVATKRNSKAKAPAPQQTASNDLGNRTSKKNPSPSSNNPSFLSGIKEVGHGTATSFKAAGSGIVNGSKALGAKIASAAKSIAGGAKSFGGKVKDGASATGDKIASAPKTLSEKTPKHRKKPQTKIATANPNIDPAVAAMPELPGKPLGEVANSLPHPKRKHPVKQQNVIARTFNKLNPFSKNKGQNGVNISASNHQNGVQ